MATKEKTTKAVSVAKSNLNNSNWQIYLRIMESFIDYNSKEKAKAEFKAKVRELLLSDGASEEFIQSRLTDNAIEDAILNEFSAEDLAWVILQ